MSTKSLIAFTLPRRHFVAAFFESLESKAASSLQVKASIRRERERKRCPSLPEKENRFEWKDQIWRRQTIWVELKSILNMIILVCVYHILISSYWILITPPCAPSPWRGQMPGHWMGGRHRKHPSELLALSGCKQCRFSLGHKADSFYSFCS